MTSRIRHALVVAIALAVFATPAHTYYDDAHYSLTYFIARACGYTSLQAHRVASADLSIDYSPNTEPEEYRRMSAEEILRRAPAGAVLGAEEPRVRFHAFRDDRAGGGKVEAEKAINEQKEFLWRLGVKQQNPGPYLHFVQDQPAHFGYASAGGHWIPKFDRNTALVESTVWGPTTDFLSYKPERARGMVADTMAALQRFRAEVIPSQRPDSCNAEQATTILNDLIAASSIPDNLLKRPNYARANLIVGQALRDDVRPFSDVRIDYLFEVGGGVKGLAAGSPNPVFGSIESGSSSALDAFVVRGALRTSIQSSAPVDVSIWAAPTRPNETPYQLACSTSATSATFANLPIGDLFVQTVAPGGSITRYPVVLTRSLQDVTIRVPTETAQSQSCAQRLAQPQSKLCALTGDGQVPVNIAQAQVLERQINAGIADLPACMSTATLGSDPIKRGLSEIQQQSAARAQALDRAISAGRDGVDKWKGLVAATEQAAQKASARNITPVATIQRAKSAGDSAALRLSIADSFQSKASSQLARAQSAGDLTIKTDYYKQALGSLREGENQARAAISGLREDEPTRSTTNSKAFEQLKLLALTLDGEQASAHLGTLKAAYDGAAKRASEVVVGSPTALENARPREYRSGALTLTDGRRIDVTAIEHAAAATGTGQSRPLFRPSIMLGAGVIVDGDVRNRAVESQTDPKVGGVALKVQLLMLDAAGVPGFHGGTFLDSIDETVVISLQQLLSRARPFASSAERWESLPADVRFPGDIDRIIGYVIDETRQDIVLIGRPSQRPQARMDLDSLILALRASWKDSTTPFVSLDPEPENPFGPQMSRVGGLPHDSIMAKTMLDADYKMKRLLIGQQPTDVAYKTIVQLSQQSPDAAIRKSRFWFYPLPLGPDAVAVSASGRTVTFNADLQVLTEQTATQAGIFESGPSPSGVEEKAALEITRALDAFSSSVKTDPDALFARLRGLTGAVTLGALMRRAGIDFPVLRDFTALPYRHLKGREAAPVSYPGAVVDYEVRRANGLWRISVGGGVELVPRWRTGVRESAIDMLADRIERQVDNGDLQRRGTIRERNLAVLTRAGGGSSDPQIAAHMLAGSSAFREGRYDAASAEFRAATLLDPASVDTYVNLAFSLDRLGRAVEARSAIRTARLLEPDDVSARLIEAAILLRANPSAQIETDPAGTLRRLIELYTANANHALMRHYDGQAAAWAADAIALGVNGPPAEAYLIRGLATFDSARSKACDDLESAARETEYVLSGGAYGDDARLYALSTLKLVHCALSSPPVRRAATDYSPEAMRAAAQELTEPIAKLEGVKEALPAYSAVFLSALRLDGLRHGWLAAGYPRSVRASEEQRLMALSADAVRRFPEDLGVLAAVAHQALDFEQPGRAIDVTTRGLLLRPADTDLLTIRATAFAVLGSCTEAQRDLAVLRKDPKFVTPSVINLRCGGQSAFARSTVQIK